MLKVIFFILTTIASTFLLRAEIPQNSALNYSRGIDKKDVGKVLSRRKRFLVFPEGSSFQLVYCLTMPTVAMADFFVFGWTAAMAWQLPDKPYLGVTPNQTTSDQDAEKRKDNNVVVKSKKIYGKKKKLSPLNKYGLHSSPSSYKTIVQSILRNNQPSYNNYYSKSKPKYKERIYYEEPFGDVVSSYHDPVYREVHRRTRRELYPKIEKFLSMQQKDGKACLLKVICQVTKLPRGQGKGSFMQEFIRVVFRVKELHDPDLEHDKYDKAANEEHDCDKMYPTCDTSIFSIF